MSRYTPPPVVVECSVIRETERAMLIEMPNGDEHWVPLSQVSRIVRPANSAELTEVHMSAWIAGEKGLA